MAFDETNNYLNALIFSLIVKAISVLILGILVLSAVKPYSIFFLTLEVVLIVIIIYSLYLISEYHKKQQEQGKNLMKAKILNPPCPDYFVRSVDADGELTCKGEYITPDGRLKYTFRPNVLSQLANGEEIEGTDIDFLNSISNETGGMTNEVPHISAGKMFDSKSLEKVCSTYFNGDGFFSQIPYTGIKPVCGSQDLFE